MTDEVIDAKGVPLRVGMRVDVGDGYVGAIVKITEPEGDVDDYGRNIQIGPKVYCEGSTPEPWEDSFLARWTASGPGDEDAPFQCDDVEALVADVAPDVAPDAHLEAQYEERSVESDVQVVMLQCQLAGAEERASVWQRIAEGREVEIQRLQERLEYAEWVLESVA